MGCPYTYLDTGELEDSLARYDQFLQQAAQGSVTVSDYRAALPDKQFISGVLPDEALQDMVLDEPDDERYQHEAVLDELQDEDQKLALHGTDLATEYLHMAHHAEDTSALRRYLGAIPRMITQKGYDRATPTGITIDELEDEQDNPGIVGRLTPSMGKTCAILGGSLGATVSGAAIGEPALMDAGTLTAYSTVPILGSNLYQHGRDQKYDDAIAERTADLIEQEIGDYTVDVVESGPFQMLTQE